MSVDKRITHLTQLLAPAGADVFAIVDVSEPNVDDQTKKMALSTLDARYLLPANNLNDLANAATARTNLNLGGLATIDDAPSDGNQYARQNAAWAVVAGGGAVDSVFGRTGVVVATAGDYTASLITNVPAGNIVAVTVQAAVDELDTEKAGLALANVFTALNKFTGGLETYRSAINDVVIGQNAGNATMSGGGNVCLGQDAGRALTIGDNNVFLGGAAGRFTTTGRFNFFLGALAGYTAISSLGGITIGYTAGYKMTANYNIFVGYESGKERTTGAGNTAIGAYAGRGGTTGAYNVFLGYLAGLNELGSNKLFIANSSTATPLIYGEFDTGLLKFHTVDAGTNTAPNTLSLVHLSSGTPAANFGASLRFGLESSTTENQDAARLMALWEDATHATRSAALKVLISNNAGEVDAAKFDDDATAGNTRLLVYDVDNGQLERVSVGDPDSGGVGYKLLRIVN